jgi:hypothetical protein
MPLTGKSKKSIVSQVMHEWRHGKLHSGNKHGKKVKSQAQAEAIALSEARLKGYK